MAVTLDRSYVRRLSLVWSLLNLKMTALGPSFLRFCSPDRI